MSIEEKLKEFSKMEEPSEAMAEWGMGITEEERLEELHNALLDIDLEETSTNFLVGIMFVLNWNTSSLEIDIICSVNKDTSTRWIRNDFAKRAYPIIKSRGGSEQLLHSFEEE